MPADARPHSAITNTVLAAFFDVYNTLGAGFREVLYERALAISLTERGLRAERQQAVTVWYHEQPVGTFRADLIVEGKVLIELKALPSLERSHVAQVLNELRATGLEVGLLLNFGPKPQIKRLVASKDRGADQRSSA